MARFSYSDADNYGGNGGGGFFSLPNDGDVARVRFLYNKLEDIEGYSVHEVEIDGKRRYVSCLREYNQPIDDCPLCKKGMFCNAKLFMPIYDVDSGQTKVWERGKKFFGKMAGLCSRYASKEDLVNHIFEVERHGKKGDTQTTYEIFDCGKDETAIEDLPEAQNPLGTIILDKSKEELQYFLDYGEFPDSGNGGDNRRTSRSEEPIRRRTPSTRNNEDTF